MASRIEDYALIGDTQTAALVSRDGSIDWACFPRFDSEACFAALLGDRCNGRWQITPVGTVRASRRCYRPGALVLENEVTVEGGGVIRVIDFMPPRGPCADIVRIVEGVAGEVDVRVDLVIRFEHGQTIPWVRRRDEALTAIAGPDALCLRGDVPMRGEDMASVGRVRVRPHERRVQVLSWFPSHQPLPPPLDPMDALAETERWWREWTGRLRYDGPYRDDVASSLMVLKALTYGPTGGIVAAATTSLPERPGGVRNWDYRYCWLRDATLTLYALMLGGYTDEARAWREWLLRAAAGTPASLQIMYGVAGERRLPEREAGWLGGYEGSRPVRIGNEAHTQLQLDVYGELVDSLYEARRFGISPDRWAWRLEVALLASLEARWREPDEGIWEVRGGARHFTHSKVMAWMAFDRAIKSAREFHLEGPVERWAAARDEIFADVCARAYDPARNTFTQSYGDRRVDAALLMIPLVGFLPVHDGRVAGTVRAIENELLEDGLVHRYRTETADCVDGLPPGEGVFLPCSFWLADAYVQMGRLDEAAALFERLIALRNDVGLLSEQYDPRARRLLGNFPQALSHLALVNTAHNLSGAATSPARRRKEQSPG